MNRREFNRGFAALATAPLVPKMAVAATAEPLHLSTPPYNWAAFVSRVHNAASPKMFKRHFQLSDDMAHQVYEVLVNEGVISTAGNASAVINPFRRYANPVDALAQLPRLASPTSSVTPQDPMPSEPNDRLTRLLSEDSPPVNQDSPDLAHDPDKDSPEPPAEDSQGTD